MKSQCKFWLPKKNRYCANSPLNYSSFCGNHLKRSDGQWIPCPIDPSHSVLQENLESHCKRCPLLKQVQSLSLQPFYQKGINAGKEEEDDNRTLVPTGANYLHASNKVSSASLCDTTSEMKRHAVHAMTIPEFSKLISKIKSIHASLCNDLQSSYKIPEACCIWINREVDGKLPFQEKHVLQQASILGNLEEFGLLKNSGVDMMREQNEGSVTSMGEKNVPAVVEFGAGRGYLTQMLADCYRIQKVILVECKSYKLKADRSLRQKQSLILERLRIDIEDLNLKAVESLKGVPYLAIGKHLCGPATDMTLRCCFTEHCDQDNAAKGSPINYPSGLAIATCCHHLCQWKHYINKRYFSNLGISKEDFHAITWFTSWAVDADHGSDMCGVSDCTSHLQFIREKEEFVEDSYSCGIETILRNMKAVERAVLGFMCKDILDMGRLMWIKEQRLEAQLVKYVPSSISPENHLLLARHNSQR